MTQRGFRAAIQDCSSVKKGIVYYTEALRRRRTGEGELKIFVTEIQLVIFIEKFVYDLLPLTK